MPHLKKAKEAEVLKTPTRPQATPTTPRTTHQATPRGARHPATGAAQPSTPAQRRERQTKEEGIIGSDRRLDAIIERNVFTPREFKQRREALTRDLFREFNKRVFADQLPSDLPISWYGELHPLPLVCAPNKRSWLLRSHDGPHRNSRLLTTAGLCKCVVRISRTHFSTSTSSLLISCLLLLSLLFSANWACAPPVWSSPPKVRSACAFPYLKPERG